MPYDPTIALKVAQPQFDVGTAMQNALALRNAQQAGQLNQLKLQQEQQAMQEAAGLQNYLAQNSDLSSEEAQNRLVSQYGQKGLDILNTRQELANRRRQGQIYQQEYDENHHKEVNRAVSDIAKYENKADALAGIERNYEEGKLDDAAYNSVKSMVQSEPVWARSQSKILQSLLSEKERLETIAPAPEKVDVGGSIKILDMNPNSPTYMKEIKSLAKTQTPAQVATTEKPLTATQKAALKKSQVEDQTNISTLKSTADDLERLTDDLVGNATKGIAPDPGLKGITGAQALLPSAPKVTVGGVEITSGKARIAQQKLDTIKGKVMALGRQLATEHGKLGNMAVQEWKFISDAVQKIDPAADNFEDQLRDIVRQARDLESRARSQYEMQYEESSAPAADGKAQLSPQDQAALDWANKNPKDPRAAQIKAKLGVK